MANNPYTVYSNGKQYPTSYGPGTPGGSETSAAWKAVSVSVNTPYEECRSVWIGTGGQCTFHMADGSTAVFSNLDDGIMLPIRVTKYSSATGVADVVFLY